MTDHFDFAIAGSTPLAAFLAGTLARVHGAKVCWIGAFLHPLRPQRGFDISVGAITRPETWRLLEETAPQTLKQLSEIGDGKVFERVDPLMVAQTSAGADALAHMSNIAREYGFQIERQAISENFVAGYQFRDVARVLRRPLSAALPAWLDDCGVVSLAPEDVKLKSHVNSLVQIAWDAHKASADCLILAGDDAVMRYGTKQDLAAHFQQSSISALLSEPVDPLPSSIIHTIDTGLTIYQRNTGALDCVGKGTANQIGRAVCAHIGMGQTLRVAGNATFTTLVSKDGGAVFGGSRTSGVVLLAGLGMTGLFQIPSIARILAGDADEFESLYFAARGPAKTGRRPAAAEFISPVLKEVEA